MNCLNCGKELKLTEGRKAKKFCESACRVRYWQKTHPVKEPKMMQKAKCEEIVAKLKKEISDLKAILAAKSPSPAQIPAPKEEIANLAAQNKPEPTPVAYEEPKTFTDFKKLAENKAMTFDEMRDITPFKKLSPNQKSVIWRLLNNQNQ